MSDISFVRRWEYDGKEFTSKAEVTAYRSEKELMRYANVSEMIADADAVIALLKPFATPRTRKPKGNGAGKAKALAKNTKANLDTPATV